MIDFHPEVIGSCFRDQYWLDSCRDAILADNDGVKIRLVVNMPLQITFTTLHAEHFFRRHRDDILDNITHKSLGRAQGQKTQTVIFGTAFTSDIQGS